MLLYAAKSDVGLVRGNNEDSLYIGCPTGGLEENLFIVADGMGGMQGGEYASRFVVGKIPEMLKRNGRKDTALALEDAVERTNRALYQISEDTEDLKGMGSTLVMAFYEKGSWHIINVGDSRAYLLEGGELKQITRDHSYVEEMVNAGRLERTDEIYQAYRHVITRAMGAESYVEEDYFHVSAAPGSRLLLCTDGVHGMLSPEQIAAALGDGSPVDAAERLVREAKEAGGSDNITVIVVERI